MGGVAALAKDLGFEVTGCDENVYPPMSNQLHDMGVSVTSGYSPEDFPKSASQVVVGNALSRGNEAVEHILNRGISYTSGPQWVAESVLYGRWVLAVAGTHGKTTTASILAWILEYAGLNPGFLIGGVANNFGVTARLTDSNFFVIEADEYDSAFFDKRSKFVHYRPRTLILNNLEFDHADIFPNLDAIKRQFHHLIRTVPSQGLIVWNSASSPLRETLEMGCWSRLETFSSEPKCQSDWCIDLGDEIWIKTPADDKDLLKWDQLGEHNGQNALAAIAGARHAGVPVSVSLAALKEFKGVRRRLEEIGRPGGITIYDDFAHHPTAIKATLMAVRKKARKNRVIAILEPRSNTMKMGAHGAEVAESLGEADLVRIFRPSGLDWDLKHVESILGTKVAVFDSLCDLETDLVQSLACGDHAVIMSNGGFGGIHEKLLRALE